MDIAEFDYELPPARIAQHPIEPRDAARLLVDRGPGEAPAHRAMRDLPGLLRPSDVLVVNDTRVLPARLLLRKATGGAVEVLVLEPDEDGTWRALVRPSRKVAPGTVVTPDAGGPRGVQVLEDLGEGQRRVRVLPDIERCDAQATLDEQLAVIDELGTMPLPPYITEPLADQTRYQTVYAARPGSAAAPTAGLHFTPDLLARIEAVPVPIERVELVVGLDTFRPIAVDRVEDHRMHSEAYRVPDDVWHRIGDARSRGGRVIAVGTTTLRALESAATRGELEGRTDLFIHGDHTFGVVDVLLTNFHLPRSSLLVLIDAFVGPRWRRLYASALDEGYRFLSFGDAMLLTRGRGA